MKQRPFYRRHPHRIGAELAAQVHERKLDVFAGAAGVPFPSFIELEAKDKVRYVAFTANEIAAVRLAMPELFVQSRRHLHLSHDGGEI